MKAIWKFKTLERYRSGGETLRGNQVKILSPVLSHLKKKDMSIKAQPNTPRSRQWFKPSQRPPYEAGDTTHSITVLGYDPEDKIHALLFFSFDTDKWHTLNDLFYLENKNWVWTRLPVPFIPLSDLLK